jgi:TLD
MKALHQHLPMSCSNENFWLKYSLVRDGASLATLESRVSMTKNTFVAIETCAGDIFGCFMSRVSLFPEYPQSCLLTDFLTPRLELFFFKKPWERTNRYEKSGESFLWRLKSRRRPPEITDSLDDEELNMIASRESDAEIFPMTRENDDCQLLSGDRIAAGGGMIDGKGGDGFGFIVEDGLAHGSSSPCVTYNNPRLVAAEDGQFKVANMEVWAMTPFLFVSDAEKNMSTIRFLQENQMNARGDAPSSAQSAWTQFL